MKTEKSHSLKHPVLTMILLALCCQTAIYQTAQATETTHNPINILRRADISPEKGTGVVHTSSSKTKPKTFAGVLSYSKNNAPGASVTLGDHVTININDENLKDGETVDKISGISNIIGGVTTVGSNAKITEVGKKDAEGIYIHSSPNIKNIIGENSSVEALAKGGRASGINNLNRALTLENGVKVRHSECSDIKHEGYC